MGRQKHSPLDVLVTGPWWLPLLVAGFAAWVFYEMLPQLAVDHPVMSDLVQSMEPVAPLVPLILLLPFVLNLIEKLLPNPTKERGRRKRRGTSPASEAPSQLWLLVGALVLLAAAGVNASRQGPITLQLPPGLSISASVLNRVLVNLGSAFAIGLVAFIAYKTFLGSWRPRNSYRATDPMLLFVSVAVLCVLALAVIPFSRGDFSLLWNPGLLNMMGLIICLLLVRTQRIHNWIMGVAGEKIAYLLARAKLRRREYRIFTNLLVPTADGTSQIDMVVLSTKGVDVVEIKCQNGKFYGHSRQGVWRKYLGGKPFEVRNPLHQNYGHIKALETALGLPNEVFRNIVAYAGFAEFPKGAPEGVTSIGGLSDALLTDRTPRFSMEQLDHLENLLREIKRNTTAEDHREHRMRLKQREKPPAEEALADLPPCEPIDPRSNLCPWCRSPLVLRTAKKGPRPGSRFFGCSGFPRCGFKCDPD